MSLILGLHLSKKLYLISDTRVTINKPSGLYECKDDLLKCFYFNKRISAIAAGSAEQAYFILCELKKLTNKNTTITGIEKIIEKNLLEIIKAYVNKRGKYTQSAFIFAGFDNQNGKEINSSKLGKILSAPFIGKDGLTMNQHIDKVITDTLAKEIILRKGLSKDEMIEVNYPRSKMFTVKANSNPTAEKFYEKEKIDCYDYAIFSPKIETPGAGFNKISIPNELLSEIEFPTKSIETGEKVIYSDSNTLVSFVSAQIKKKGFNAAGGHIFTLLVTREGSVFPTGPLMQIKNGRAVKIGGIFVNNGKITYELKNGVKGIYRDLASINNSAGMEI